MYPLALYTRKEPRQVQFSCPWLGWNLCEWKWDAEIGLNKIERFKHHYFVPHLRPIQWSHCPDPAQVVGRPSHRKPTSLRRAFPSQYALQLSLRIGPKVLFFSFINIFKFSLPSFCLCNFCMDPCWFRLHRCIGYKHAGFVGSCQDQFVGWIFPFHDHHNSGISWLHFLRLQCRCILGRECAYVSLICVN